MRLYSCKVRLEGSLYNEVRKIGVTAAEIQLLRLLHSLNPEAENEDGTDENLIDESVVGDIVFTGEVDRTDAQERSRLTELYGPALKRFDSIKNIKGVFGVGVPLPAFVPDENVKSAPKKRAPKKKAEPKKAEETETETQSDLADLA